VGVERLDGMLLLAQRIRRHRRIILEVKLPVLERAWALHRHPFAAREVGDAPMHAQDLKDSSALSAAPGRLRTGGLCPAPKRREEHVDPACGASVLAGDP
jgi:hypothetical protein